MGPRGFGCGVSAGAGENEPREGIVVTKDRHGLAKLVSHRQDLVSFSSKDASLAR